MSCKYYEQGLTHSFCGHKDATDEEKSYRYWIDECDNRYENDKWEEGTAQSRLYYMNKEGIFKDKV